jgi:hypothetical protein
MTATRKGETAAVESFKEKAQKVRLAAAHQAASQKTGRYLFDSCLRSPSKGWRPKMLEDRRSGKASRQTPARPDYAAWQQMPVLKAPVAQLTQGLG